VGGVSAEMGGQQKLCLGVPPACVANEGTTDSTGHGISYTPLGGLLGLCRGFPGRRLPAGRDDRGGVANGGPTPNPVYLRTTGVGPGFARVKTTGVVKLTRQVDAASWLGGYAKLAGQVGWVGQNDASNWPGSKTRTNCLDPQPRQVGVWPRRFDGRSASNCRTTANPGPTAIGTGFARA
jgi:hypothetical protein